jgi:hypothetical protein
MRNVPVPSHRYTEQEVQQGRAEQQKHWWEIGSKLRDDTENNEDVSRHKPYDRRTHAHAACAQYRYAGTDTEKNVAV